MKFNLYIGNNNFIITNLNIPIQFQLENKIFLIDDNISQIFGYCFTENDILKNKSISNVELEWILENREKNSGIYTVINKRKDAITLNLDPLSQYSVYYYQNDEVITLSNNLFLISQLHGLTILEDRYLYDSIAYQSPLRGFTILKDVFVIQYDDLLDARDTSHNKYPPPLSKYNFSILKNRRDIYSGLSYQDLLHICVSNLKKRAKVLAMKYDEIHIQLTGGADSRLVTSVFLAHENTYHYCYGDGNSQNRLFFEQITSKFNLRKSDPILFCGANLNNSSLIFRGLYDSNCRKLNNLNTYMNSNEFINTNKCKITGYYGANISGGVVLPPKDTTSNPRINLIPPEHFTYHDYVNDFKNRHKNLRRCNFNDLFYINNRGQSHYAAHSIADNLKCNSFDILYDPINFELVKNCPYSDEEIDKNAISVDLIHINNIQLALFPYDSRKIPAYKKFENVPLISCFDHIEFPKNSLGHMSMSRPIVDIEKFDILNKGHEFQNQISMLQYKELDDFFVAHPFLRYLREDNSITASIVLFYAFATILIQSRNK
jgi:hypothetical protein